MYHCENCDGVVSRDFVRVFGTTENRVYRCPECAFMTDIRNGEGVYTAPPIAQRDYEATRWAQP